MVGYRYIDTDLTAVYLFFRAFCIQYCAQAIGNCQWPIPGLGLSYCGKTGFDLFGPPFSLNRATIRLTSD